MGISAAITVLVDGKKTVVFIRSHIILARGSLTGDSGCSISLQVEFESSLSLISKIFEKADKGSNGIRVRIGNWRRIIGLSRLRLGLRLGSLWVVGGLGLMLGCPWVVSVLLSSGGPWVIGGLLWLRCPWVLLSGLLLRLLPWV